MVNAALIENKLAQLAEYLLDLKEVKDIELQQFKFDKKTQRYIERTLHLAIECCLDIGNHIIADQNLREPNDKKDIFAVLEENNLISAEVLPNLLKMTQFRNILVHDYAKIDPAIIYKILQEELDDFQRFIVDINKMLKAY